jgi:hypothetical protein
MTNRDNGRNISKHGFSAVTISLLRDDQRQIRVAGGKPMGAKLNHTVVYVRDKNESASLVSEILGLDAPLSVYGFAVVTPV